MIEYYNRSAAGYKFMRTVFTIPSVKTIQKWLSKPNELKDLNEDAFGNFKENSETGNDEVTYQPHNIKLENIGQGSISCENFSQAKMSAQNLEYEDNSVDDYDSEESGLKKNKVE